PVRGELRLTGVTHAGLRDLTLKVSPGEFLGIAPTDPADATTLLRCLSRETDPTTGTIELDGVPLHSLDPSALRTAVLVAHHDAALFEDTLLANIAPPPDTTPSGSTTVEAAMAAAGADEVARTAARGMETPLSEGGRSLSGGQRQRVALARALAAARPVLVVHDPTTAVDAVTEARIASGLRDHRRGRTTIVVTTSPALLAATDRVALLDDGRIVDTAPHTEMIRRHATYRTAVLS
ncbi:ABC transporter ATP-binding protein, partial [Sphaerisporangium sp. B11E5]|uniref:ABC transporter ATP-binding protein n=1 Tax=Sphaerisporangium sp. B11E5 TaxID=3153563 RepID=UPI00325D43A5